MSPLSRRVAEHDPHVAPVLEHVRTSGWGPKMRSWLVKHRLIKSESATEYGARARGRLAFELREAWPPARGDSYGLKEYEGVLAPDDANSNRSALY